MSGDAGWRHKVNWLYRLVCGALLLWGAALPVAAADGVQVGEQVTATVTLAELYQDPGLEEWRLGGETALESYKVLKRGGHLLQLIHDLLGSNPVAVGLAAFEAVGIVKIQDTRLRKLVGLAACGRVGGIAFDLRRAGLVRFDD